jgi:hypothetical protein
MSVPDSDKDGIADPLDICPYDPNNDFDNDGVCSVGCSTGPSISGTKINGFICASPATLANVTYDRCQGGAETDSNGNSIPDACEDENTGCKVVFGAENFFNLYLNDILLTGNQFLPAGFASAGSLIDNVYFKVASYNATSQVVVAISATDTVWPVRQIRGVFAKVSDPICGTSGCALCDALPATYKRTSPAQMPWRCQSINDFPGALPDPCWKTLSCSNPDSCWSNSTCPLSVSGSGGSTNIADRLWNLNNGQTRYNSPTAVWGSGSYTVSSEIYCRYTYP